MHTKILFFLFTALLFGCGKQPGDAAKPNHKPLVLVSIAPYRFLTEQISGDAVDVQTIIPSGANPHAYEPTSRQVLEIGRGHIWFRIGEPFENKIISFLEVKNPDLSVHDLREGIDLIESEHTSSHCCLDHLDRHIWLSPKLAASQAEMIAHILSERFPEHRAYFKTNLDHLLAELSQLDQDISAMLTPVQHRSLIVSHPAFAYFCRDYNLEQLSVEQEGKDPRPRHLEEMMSKARQKGVEIALALPQYNNKGAQLIAEQLHVPVKMIDPYSANYLETMRKLARLIAFPPGSQEGLP